MNRRRYPCIYVLLFVFIVGLNQLPSFSDDWPMLGRDASRNAVSPESTGLYPAWPVLRWLKTIDYGSYPTAAK